MRSNSARRLLLFNAFAFSSIVLLFSSCVHSSRTTQSLEQTEIVQDYDYKNVDRAPSSSPDHRSGYKIASEKCGRGDLAFAKLSIDMRPGYCAGLVASEESGLLFPRTIAQLPNSDDFLVVDMGGWAVDKGKVWLLERFGSEYKLRVLLEGLDQPHGLKFGKDGKAYVGLMTEIFRFDPRAPRPETTKEVVVRGFEGRSYRHGDGTFLKNNAHPLKEFVFDRLGNIYVNVGAPSDACATQSEESRACSTSEGARASAAIWKYRPQVPGQPFRTLRSGESGPTPEVFARGLRNSMALAVHERYPDAGYAFLQGENARDLKDPAQPHEELNAIEQGKHYGWPYCYNVNTPSPEYKKFLSRPGPYQNLCTQSHSYRAPYSVLPPHAAPLGMSFYRSDRFPELKNTLLMSWHGYMPAGNRIAFSRVDERGFPVRQQVPTTYNMNCEGARYSSSEDRVKLGGAQFQELVVGWYAVSGVRPLGAPVGMTVARDGSIWVVEDKNKTIIRIDVDHDMSEKSMSPCEQRSEGEIQELLGYVQKSPENMARVRVIRKQLVEKHCLGCHTNFNLKPEVSSESQRDLTVARFVFSQDGWFNPGDYQDSHLYRRTRALGATKPMPANAAELFAHDLEYQNAVKNLDQFLANVVPGRPGKIISEGFLRVRNQNKVVCGSLPPGTRVIVLDRNSKLSGFSPIYRPARKFLNQSCQPTDQYYVGTQFVGSIESEAARNPQSEEKLFESKRLTEKGLFTFGIEGPAVGPDGTLYVVNFQKQGTIGKVDAKGRVDLLTTLPSGSVANSIRFNSKGEMFFADYRAHKIWKYSLPSKSLEEFAHDPKMSQPNDMTIAQDGSIYASDPNWRKRKGQIWRVSPKGVATSLVSGIGTANGIDLSPDEKTLYVGESNTQKIWAYPITQGGLGERTLVIEFKESEIDGLKTDTAGNIYVTRIGKSSITKLTPDGRIIRDIKLLGKEPTNLAFGGPDGKTVYVTQRDGGYVETFRVDEPGREWK